MASTNEALVTELIDHGYLKTPLIIEAFRHIDRRDFVPAHLVKDAYVNAPLPIGEGQTISQPLTVAFMLELLEPKPKERILDIGAGSGWQSALLGYIVSKGEPATGPHMDLKMELPKGLRLSSLGLGEVIAVERVQTLAEMAKHNVQKYQYISRRVVEVLWHDATQGVSPELVLSEGFDKIIAAASAGEIPETWKKQLKVGGRIVAPVEKSIFVIDKKAAEVFMRKEFPNFAFVPLVEGLSKK